MRMRIIFCVSTFLYGPLLYLYTLSLIRKDFSVKPMYALHFILSLILILNIFLGYPIWDFVRPLVYLSLFPYLIFAILEISKYRKIIAQTQSSVTQSDLSWLLWTMIIYCFVVFSDLIEYMMSTQLLIGSIPVVDTTVLFSVNWMFFKGLKQPQIFLGISINDKLLLGRNKTKNQSVKIKKSEIDKIINYMNDKKPFLNSTLSLSDLAMKLQMTDRRLSNIINYHFNKNFISFINDYRLLLAEDLLLNPTHKEETISEILYATGFNSKSTFNSLFKQKTGFTPTEFKKRHSSS